MSEDQTLKGGTQLLKMVASNTHLYLKAYKSSHMVDDSRVSASDDFFRCSLSILVVSRQLGNVLIYKSERPSKVFKSCMSCCSGTTS